MIFIHSWCRLYECVCAFVIFFCEWSFKYGQVKRTRQWMETTLMCESCINDNYDVFDISTAQKVLFEQVSICKWSITRSAPGSDFPLRWFLMFTPYQNSFRLISLSILINFRFINAFIAPNSLSRENTKTFIFDLQNITNFINQYS